MGNFIKLNKKKLTISFLGALILIVGTYHITKPMSDNLNYESEVYEINSDQVDFLYDLSYEDSEGNLVFEQNIFDEILKVIDSAEKYILIDMFLWSSNGDNVYRNLGQEITDHLVAKKKINPDIQVVVITDPLNTNYGSFENSYFSQLESSDIDVVFSDLNSLPDSNILYSPFWRTFGQIWGEPKTGWIQTPFFEEKTSIRSVFKVLNFKANHRKIMIADHDDSVYSFVISANPSGSGSTHSNIGFLIKDYLYKDIYTSEKTIAGIAGYDLSNLDLWNFDFVKENTDDQNTSVQFITEGKIKEKILEAIRESQEKDSIKLAMFYFGDRDILDELVEAFDRGVEIKIILDPSKTGFGRDKYGIPSRAVASNFMDRTDDKINIRYYKTRDEQFHTKLLLVKKEKELIIIGGSANYTRRNLDSLNLEADVKITTSLDTVLAQEVENYFDRIWKNDGGIFTAEYEDFDEPSWFRYIQYRFQELSGTGTF
ncbi:phospholipase [Patescibacteria group bacterium]|nr:phospholipase [Patescibacteria group bacterium]